GTAPRQPSGTDRCSLLPVVVVQRRPAAQHARAQVLDLLVRRRPEPRLEPVAHRGRETREDGRSVAGPQGVDEDRPGLLGCGEALLGSHVESKTGDPLHTRLSDPLPRSGAGGARPRPAPPPGRWTRPPA